MKKEDKMILPEDAQKITGRYGKVTVIEKISLVESLGRVLGEDIFSDIEMPPFDKSAMDGFAVNSKDRSERFEIIETVPAGKFPEKELKDGQCARIMTGAPLPYGADSVIKVEITEVKQGYMYLTGEDKASNVCNRGEDIKSGDRVLKKGVEIRAAEIGAIASLGYSEVNVYKKITAGIITTGSEIKEPGDKLPPGFIYNSNGYSLSAQLISSGALVSERKSVNDEKNLIKSAVSDLLETTDIIIISGGVSMGEFDYVPEILEELGVSIHFNKVAIQPGKPTLFGTKEGRVVFGLPGNPVSTFVIFEVMVKPVLRRMSGAVTEPVNITAILGSDFQRRKTERDLYVPVCYDKAGIVKLIEYHGSAHFISLSKANGLLKIGRGIKKISKGAKVDVRQI